MKRYKLRVGKSDVELTEESIRDIHDAFFNGDSLGPFSKSVVDAIISHYILNNSLPEMKRLTIELPSKAFDKLIEISDSKGRNED